MNRRRRERKSRIGNRAFQAVCSKCGSPIAMRSSGFDWAAYELGSIPVRHQCPRGGRWDDPNKGRFGNGR